MAQFSVGANNLIVGAALTTAGSNENTALATLDSKLEDLALHVDHAWREPLLRAAEPDFAELRKLALPLLTDRGRREARRPFHWLAEFPEVFLRGGVGGGFDAMVGNPPFVGGQKITGLFGDDYRDHLVLHLAEGRRGSADLCAYFFLRAMQLVRPGGTVGLLAVNTIAEGDTRQVGLEAMMRAGHDIHAAWPNFQWPGAAAVVASEVHMRRAIDGHPWTGGYRISNAEVPTISAFLSAEDEWSPKPLKANEGKSFIGSNVLGLGFTMGEDEAKALIGNNPMNAEALFPYLNGEDLNSHPAQKPSRWVINFWDWPLARTASGSWMRSDEKRRKLWLQSSVVPADFPDRVAEDFPELLATVREKVKPERDNNNRDVYRSRWWHFAEKRPGLYHALGLGASFVRHPEGWSAEVALPVSVFACARVSKFWCPTLVDSRITMSEQLVVFASENEAEFGLLQSNIHGEWARKMASSLESRLRYTPSDIYETFPKPAAVSADITAIGNQFSVLRREIMLRRNLGLTDLYNRLHDPANHDQELFNLRNMMARLDSAVLAAYGWEDLEPGHGFQTVPYLPENDRVRYTISESARLEVLRRLARLNRERWQAEQDEALAALHDVEAARLAVKSPRRKGPALKLVADPQQTGLF